MAWVVFVEPIFLFLYLKPDDGFLPYNMSDVFNKTGIASQTLKFPEINLSQFCTGGIENGTYIYCAGVKLKTLQHGWGFRQILYRSLE